MALNYESAGGIRSKKEQRNEVEKLTAIADAM